jgi:hypothetical protein
MNKILFKTATGIATAAIVVSSFATAALATVDVTISGNGADTNNTAKVETSNTTIVTQTNTANISNNVSVTSNTGGNKANSNTGGDVSVSTGNATSNVGISNTANSNAADVSGCNCSGDVNATISGNGANSKNDLKLETESKTWVTQNNTANVSNNVDAYLTTGKNEANKNTGGGVSIETGNAEANNITVHNAVNKNVASVGGGSNGGGTLAVVISGNGANSNNKAKVEAESETGVIQNNVADISNSVEVTAKTGKNKADSNTGGDVSIETGNAMANVDVSNLANFNAADVSSCGCLISGTVKVKDNGADTKNEAKVELGSASFVTQDNLFGCSEGEWLNWSEKDGCNNVSVKSDTGNNKADKNTQGSSLDPSIMTGDAGSDVMVGTSANTNVVGNAGVDFGFPEFPSGSNGNSVSLLLMLLHFFS